MQPRLICVCGPNGAGKSTYTRSVATNENMLVIDPTSCRQMACCLLPPEKLLPEWQECFYGKECPLSVNPR